MIQLELFPEVVDQKKVNEEIRNEWTKTRKALFAKEAETRKLIQELAYEFQMLKFNICRGRIPFEH